MRLYNIVSKIFKTKDYAKLFLWGAYAYLSLTFIWPKKKKSVKTMISFSIQLFLLLFLITGFVFYIQENLNDFNKMSKAFSVLAPIPGMTLYKLCFLVYAFADIKKLMDEIMSKFWPYNIIEGESLEYIIKAYKYSNIAWLMFCIMAIMYVLASIVAPIFNHEIILPFDTIYPYNWKISPFYEITYFLQATTLVSPIFLMVAGIDFLLFELLVATSCQYSILTSCISAFNTDDMCKVNMKMRKICRYDLDKKYDIKTEYFVRCVRHHQMLLKFMKKLNRVLNPLEFCHLIFSIISVCFGILRLTTIQNMSFIDMTISIIYVVGFITQLFIDCFLGTHLYYQASLLPNAIFHNKWEDLEDTSLKKDINFFLMHSQRIPQLNAYNLYDMNMVSFVKVIKVAFSAYTVLSTIQKRST